MTERKSRISATTARFIILGVVGAGLALMPAAKADEALPTDTQQSALATNLGIYGGDNWDIAVDGDHVYTIASGVPNGFFYSSDAAVTWQRPAGTNDLGAGSQVEVDTASHAVYVALNGLYKSTDYGATLTKIADYGYPLLFAQGKLLTGSNEIAYVSADNGATFTGATIAAGENIMSFASSKTAGTFYAVTRGSGNSHLYVSTDNGATWTIMSGTPAVTTFSMVNADPNHANILTISGDNNLWLSDNTGTTWTDIGTAASRPCGDFSIWNADSSRWYACGGYSTDNGSTWTNMDTRTNVMRGPGKVVVMNAANESVMYGDCMGGVCKTTDGGLTWNNAVNGITGVNVQMISYTTDKKTAWISSSNGLGKTTNFNEAVPTWTWPILPCDPVSGPTHRCDSSGMGESVWVKPDNADIVLAGAFSGWVYRSTDGGTTWTSQVPEVVNVAKFKSGSDINIRMRDFINDPSDPNIVYLAAYDPIEFTGAVLKSTDAGITWTDLGLKDDAPATTLAVTSNGVLYAGTGFGTSTTKGMYKYADGAWTKLSGIPETVNVTDVMVDPENQSVVYATVGADSRYNNDGFYKSLDGGTTWTMAAGLTNYYGFNALTVDKRTSPNTIYMACRDNDWHGLLMKSSDRGNTWGVLYTGLKSETFNSVVFDGLVVGSKHGVLSLKSKVGYSGTKLSATKVRKNSYVTLSSTLKDVTTKKLIKNSTVKLYYKSGNTWKLKATTKSNSKTGKFSFRVKIAKNIQYRMTWTPGSTNRAEYTSSNSKTYTIKLK